MLSRRSFLLGGAAAAVVGAGGVEAYGREKVLHRVGLLRSPDHHVPASGWPVEERTLPSGTRWALAVPPEGDLAGIILCLHGRGGDRRYAFDTIHLHDVVAAEGLRLGVAALDGGADSYWHRRADGRDSAADVDELVRRMTGTHFTRVALLGWSMGGYGALLAAERQQFIPAVIASSPALFPTYADATPGAFDDARDFTRNDVFGPAGRLDRRRVRVDCGTRDPFAPAARRFAALSGATGHFSRGWHDAAYWRSVAPAQVRFAMKGFSLPLE